jgi:hypothetical protein
LLAVWQVIFGYRSTFSYRQEAYPLLATSPSSFDSLLLSSRSTDISRLSDERGSFQQYSNMYHLTRDGFFRCATTYFLPQLHRGQGQTPQNKDLKVYAERGIKAQTDSI